MSESQKRRWRLAHITAAADALGGAEEMVVVVPVGADDGEAEHVDEQVGQPVCSAESEAPPGGFTSKAMIVMMTAITPSLKASSLSVSLSCIVPSRPFPAPADTTTALLAALEC